MAPRIIIAGGGTGGHIFPAVAIGHALQRQAPGTELLFVGARGKMEMEKIPQEGFRIIGLDIAGFNRSRILSNWALPVKLLRSVYAARRILREFRPACVVGVGGYASFPILRAAQRMGIPTVLQEQNSFAGRSNQILGRRARRICVAYESMERFFPADRIVVTGNPVRRAIGQAKVSREEGQLWLGMDAGKKTLLVIGGSLGAKSVNEAIAAALPELMKGDVQLIWQTGNPYYEQAKEAAKVFEGCVKVYAFIREMEYAYAAADIVVSRAGALAIAELCIAAKPVLFVPYPFAAEDHQTSNAAALVRRNAAMMIPDKDVKTDLLKKLTSLLHDQAMQDIMTQNLKAAAITDADERIAAQVLELAAETQS